MVCVHGSKAGIEVQEGAETRYAWRVSIIVSHFEKLFSTHKGCSVLETNMSTNTFKHVRMQSRYVLDVKVAYVGGNIASIVQSTVHACQISKIKCKCSGVYPFLPSYEGNLMTIAIKSS